MRDWEEDDVGETAMLLEASMTKCSLMTKAAGGEANTIVAHADSRRWLARGFLGKAGRVFLALTRNKFAVILESDTCAIRVKSIVFSVSRGGVGRTTIGVTVRTKFLGCGDAEIL